MLWYILFAVFLLPCCLSQQQNLLPRTFPAVTSQGHDGECPLAEERAAIREQITEQVLSLLNISSESQPPCACGGPGQWTRIAHLDMSDPSQQCPSNWSLSSTPIRGCQSSDLYSCASTTFPSSGQLYSRVCGRVRAYQQGSTAAFGAHLDFSNLEQSYVDGISLTHGAEGSRQHIWTFASAHYQTDSRYEPSFNCPCTNTGSSWPYEVPEFVGDNYFCDTGNPGVCVPKTMDISSLLMDISKLGVHYIIFLFYPLLSNP